MHAGGRGSLAPSPTLTLEHLIQDQDYFVEATTFCFGTLLSINSLGGYASSILDIYIDYSSTIPFK